MTPFLQHLEPAFIFVQVRGLGLRLVVKPSIYLFCITHSFFISTLHFCLNFIQPSASNIFTCDCGHELDVSNIHLVRCPFGGQRIATHDAIQNVMYAFIQKHGHVVCIVVTYSQFFQTYAYFTFFWALTIFISLSLE
jgi:hypothetical protein